jgi:hypothetical protein
VSPQRSWHREDGVVALVYAITLFVIFGMLALVFDLGAVRLDRRAAQSTADLAASAGAMQLLEAAEGSPNQACRAAIDYFVANTANVTHPGYDACGSFPTESACPADRRTAELSLGDYAVDISWPIDLDDGGLQYDEEFDGDRCERVEVRIVRTRGFVFAPVTGAGNEGTAGARAVARAKSDVEGQDLATLLILDKNTCAALEATGGGGSGGVTVLPHLFGSDHPYKPGEHLLGRIHLDSSGTVGCADSGNTTHTVQVSSNNRIRAYGPEIDGVRLPGDLRLFALPPGAVTCPTTGPYRHACRQASVASSSTTNGLWPQPQHLPKRSNRTAADHEFNCRASYSESDGYYGVGGLNATAPNEHASTNQDWEVPGCEQERPSYIAQLRTAIGTANVNPSPHDPTSNPQGFRDWRALGGTCAGAPPPSTPLVGNWYVDCPTGFNLTQDVRFQAGNVILTGPVNPGGRVFAVNDRAEDAVYPGPEALPSQCRSEVCVTEYARNAAFLYIGRDGIRQTANSSHLILRNTMVYLHRPLDAQGSSRVIDVNGGDVSWTPPTAHPLGYPPDLARLSPFQGLSLWSDKPTPLVGSVRAPDELRLSGNGSIDVTGVFFSPNTRTTLGGGGAGTSYRAQFFTWKLAIAGGANIQFSPPDGALYTPTFEGISLIR